VVVVVVVLLVLASVVQSDAHFWGRHKHRTLGIGIEISSVLCSAAAFASFRLTLYVTFKWRRGNVKFPHRPQNACTAV